MHFRASTVALVASLFSSVLAAPAPNPVLVERQGSETLGLGQEPSPTYVGSAYGNLEVIASLITAPLQADRIALLKDEDFVFDFRNPTGNIQVATGNGKFFF